MHHKENPRERVRQLSIVVYVVMLALILPMTLFLAKQENTVRSQASGRVAPMLSLTPTVTPSY